MLDTRVLPARLMTDGSLSDWEREAIEELLRLPFNQWPSSADEIMKPCPKVFMLAKHRYLREAGRTQEDILGKISRVGHETEIIVTAHDFAPFPKRCDEKEFVSFRDSVLNGEAKGQLYDRRITRTWKCLFC